MLMLFKSKNMKSKQAKIALCPLVPCLGGGA